MCPKTQSWFGESPPSDLKGWLSQPSVEGMQGLCQTRKENVVDTEQMNRIPQIQQAIFLQTVQNFIEKVCHAGPDISPQALNSRSEAGITQLKTDHFSFY